MAKTPIEQVLQENSPHNTLTLITFSSPVLSLLNVSKIKA